MDTTNNLIDQKKLINSAYQVKKDVEDRHGVMISKTRVKRVLKQNKAFHFKRVKKVPLHANSLRNQHMRQQFSLKMLELLVEGKRILNVDETWFGESCYVRTGWQMTMNQESLRNNIFQPRITMFVAMDNFGDVYLSLMQTNNN